MQDSGTGTVGLVECRAWGKTLDKLRSTYQVFSDKEKSIVF